MPFQYDYYLKFLGDHHIQPGHYDYPFVFQIPGNCPSTYEGEYGHVRYEIKIVVDKAFQFDQKKTVELRVIAPLDLNQNPYCKVSYRSLR